MTKWLTILLALTLACAATAEEVNYGWEDGGTVLGIYPDPDLPSIFATNVADWMGGQVHSGNFALKLEDNAESGTPQAYVAYIWGLMDGDQVTVGFWRYDDTPDGAPSCRIWGHWNDELPDNPDGYSGSAGGNDDYGPGTGWDYTEWTWDVVDGHTGLVIEVRTYSSPGDIVYIDDMSIMTSSEMHFIQIPGCSPVGTEARTLSNVRTLFE